MYAGSLVLRCGFYRDFWFGAIFFNLTECAQKVACKTTAECQYFSFPVFQPRRWVAAVRPPTAVGPARGEVGPAAGVPTSAPAYCHGVALGRVQAALVRPARAADTVTFKSRQQAGVLRYAQRQLVFGRVQVKGVLHGHADEVGKVHDDSFGELSYFRIRNR